METPCENLDGSTSVDSNESGEKTTAAPCPPDASSPSRHYITQLRENDVLLGRGTGPCSHEGNVRFRDVIEAMRPRYVATPSRKAKTKVVLKTVEMIKTKKGRFLRKVVETNSKGTSRKPQQEIYELVPDSVAFEKTKQAIRYVHYRKDADGRNLTDSRTADREDTESRSQGSKSAEGLSSISFRSAEMGDDSSNGRIGRPGVGTKESIGTSRRRPRSANDESVTSEESQLAQRTLNLLFASGPAPAATLNPPSQPLPFNLPANNSGSNNTTLLQELIRQQQENNLSNSQLLPASAGGGGRNFLNLLEQAAAQPHQGYPHTASVLRQDASYSSTPLEQALTSVLRAGHSAHQPPTYTAGHDSLQSILQQHHQHANANHHLEQAQHHLQQAMRQQGLMSSAASGATTASSSFGQATTSRPSLDSILLRSSITQQLLPSPNHSDTYTRAAKRQRSLPQSQHLERRNGSVAAMDYSPPPQHAQVNTASGDEDGSEESKNMTRPDRILLRHAIEDPRVRTLLLSDEKCRRIIESYSVSET